jgi:predicted type IV restriction endonuclease
MANLSQISRDIKKRLKAFDFQSALKHSIDEAKTRHYLIEPFFQMLGYELGFGNGQMVTEFDADYGNMKGKKVDYAILFKGKPSIIIESKKANFATDLQKGPLRQLNDYFTYLNDAQIGILTNGVEYHFYSRYEEKGLNTEPFFSFYLSDIDGSDVDELSRLHLSAIDIKSILSEADEKYFIDKFQEALTNELLDPSWDLLKAIYQRMGGNRLSPQTADKIKGLINSVSLKSVVDSYTLKDVSSANSGIETTSDELEVYQIIRTILAQSRKVETDRIGYRDQKTVFSILIDDNLRKKVCDLDIKDKYNRSLILDGEKYDIPEIDDVLKLKKQLIDKTASFME